MNILYLLFVIIFFTSCSHSLISQGQDGIIVYAIRKEHNFTLATKGLLNQAKLDAYDKEQSKIRESYITKKYRFNSVATARDFFCNLFEEYIKPFNKDSRLKFPFTAHNVEIEVRFTDDQGLPLVLPSIAKVKNVAGLLYYYSYDSQTKEYRELAHENYCL